MTHYATGAPVKETRRAVACINARTWFGPTGILIATPSPHKRSAIMGKYFLGWLLGVPAVVLFILYLIFH
jgi:hypothetical protein